MMTYVLAGGIAVLALGLLVGLLSPKNRLFLAIVLIFATGATGQLPGTSAYAFRIAAFAAAIGAALGLARAPLRLPQASLVRLACLLTVMLAIPAVVHHEVSPFLNGLTGTALLLLVSYAAQRVSPDLLIRAFNAGPWGIITLSTPLIAIPSLGVVGENFRGVTENSNSLGIYCVLAISSALFLIDTTGVRRILLVAWPIALCVMAHSRTSLIAIAVLLACSALIRQTAGRRFLAVAALAGGVIAFINPEIFYRMFGGVIDKTGGTRNLSVLEAQRAWGENWLYGLGFDGVHNEVASSPLRAIAVGGAAMLLFYLLAVLTMLVHGLRAGPRTLAFAVAAIIHSLGEGWMISTTGPWILAFCCGLLACTAKDVIFKEEGMADARRAE